MGFGYNRYMMVLAGLALSGLAFTGCSDSKRKNNASTVSAATSSTTGATTSNGAPAGMGPMLTAATFVDTDGDKMLSKGDKVTLTFSAEVAQITSQVDPSQELSLSVGGDSFGVGATMQNGLQPNQLDVMVGDQAVLRISDTFDIAKTTPGEASGINVSFAPTLVGVDSGTIRASGSPVDIDGALQAGFLPAGSMNFARGGHSAVVLDDGRVLIVGGVAAKGSKGYVAEPEVFDPLTKSFSLTSNLAGKAGVPMRGKVPVRMVNATATKLNDGTVLISGGFGIEKKSFFGFGKDKVDTLESAFIFDPATNEFKRVGDMKHSRHSHTATVMADGKVLITGGYNDSFWKKHKTQAPIEIYDPAKKKFDTVGGFLGFFTKKTKESRMNHSATAIEGGTGILLTGGNYYSGGGLFGLFKPKLKMTKGSEVVRDKGSEKAGDLNFPRMRHTAEAITPREVLIAGGHDPSSIMGALEVYDSATGSWSHTGNLAMARTGCQIAMDRTKAMIIGGTNGSAELDTVEVFNADSKSLSQETFKLATGRNGHTVSKLKDGRILVIGGFTGATSLDGLDGSPLASAEVFVRQ